MVLINNQNIHPKIVNQHTIHKYIIMLDKHATHYRDHLINMQQIDVTVPDDVIESVKQV